MIDLGTVALTGAVNIPKCRALWQDGTMKLFDKTGQRIMQFTATEPRRAHRFRNVREADTDKGPVRLSAKCMTCGGWWRAARHRAEVLWDAG